MTRFLPVAGTHSWRGQQAGSWWQTGSPWLRYMAEHGLAPYAPDRPFVWTTALDGLWSRHHLTWQAAGENLYAYLAPPVRGGEPNGVSARGDETRIVAHSHGAQVVAYACARGLKVHRLITVGSPPREDMATVWRAARPQIGRWVHIHSDWTDRWQWLGTIGDGVFGISRQMPRADRNVGIAGVGHTGILADANHFGWWEVEALVEELRG